MNAPTVAAAAQGAGGAGPVQPAFGPRMMAGLGGILLAAMVAGLNNRIPGLVLADIEGALGVGQDDGSWLNTAYFAGELAVMPFATWFAVTFSLRRAHGWALGVAVALALLLPFIRSLPLLITLRAVQGLFAGALIPMLMMAALRFLPPPVRLYGLALYAMTATFAPNVALWLSAVWVDRMEDWRWAYWHIVPFGLAAMALVQWGIPQLPLALGRIGQANWLGMALGVPGLALLVVGLDQGVRLEWFSSPLIRVALGSSFVLIVLWLVSEWSHPAPFMRLQLLGRRNLGMGFTVFFLLLIAMSSAVALPASVLGRIQGFRMEQIAPIGLAIALPQLVLGPLVAMLLYRSWVDARHLFALGLLLIATACWLGAGVTSEWMTHQFLWATALQAVGQPLAVISMLFLGTSVVAPMEGPYVAGIVNTLRALGTVFGGAMIGQMVATRSHFHAEMLLDQAGRRMSQLPAGQGDWPSLGAVVSQQAAVLAAADVYRALGLLALLLIPFVLRLQHIPAPRLTQPPPVMPPPGMQPSLPVS